MRPVKIALCSPGLDRATAGSVTCGLDFLASLIQKRQPVEFFTVAPKDVMKLSQRDCDFLLVSFTAVPCITDYACAVKFKKPSVTTLFGGPGVYCPGALVEMADAVMVGRGETAIFKALSGDYSGMATRNNAFKKDSVEIFATDLLSPLATSVGCQCVRILPVFLGERLCVVERRPGGVADIHIWLGAVSESTGAGGLAKRP